LQLFDGISRIISKKDPWRGEHDDGVDGLRTITQLKYTIDAKSENPNDNIFTVNNPRISVVNVSTFLTHVPFGTEEYYNYDLREPKRKIIHPDRIRETTKTVASTQDWTNIPYYPTTLEKKENMVKYLTSMGKQVPPALLQQIAAAKKMAVEQDAFNSFTPNAPPHPPPQQHHQQQRQQHPQHPQHPQPRGPPPHKYSPQYAAYVGAKPRAQASARVGMGGSF
jgi:hypothetical protein